MESTIDAFDSDLSDVDTPEAASTIVDEEVAAPEATETVAAAGADEDVEAATSEVPDEKAVAAAALAATAGKPAAAPAPKQFTFTAEGKPVAVAENAEIDWKVDGKSEKVKVKDLLDNWSGKVSYDRKFNELSQQRKGFQEESGTFQRDKARQTALINDMHTAATEGRIFDAVSNMLEMTGLDKKMDAKTYLGTLRGAMLKQAQALSGMTPEQRALHDRKEEQDYREAKFNRLDQQRTQEQADRAFHERVTKVIDSVKTTPEEFVKARNWLVEKFNADKQDLNTLTPEFIAKHIADVRDYGIAKKAMESVDPELTKNEALWEQTVSLMRANPTWTEEDVKEIFQKAVGEKRSNAVSKKLAKSPVATAAKGAAKSKMTKKVDPDDYSTFSKDEVAW